MQEISCCLALKYAYFRELIMEYKEKKQSEKNKNKADSSDISEIMHRLKTHPFLKQSAPPP